MSPKPFFDCGGQTCRIISDTMVCVKNAVGGKRSPKIFIGGAKVYGIILVDKTSWKRCLAMKKRFPILSLVILLVVLTTVAFAQDFKEMKKIAEQGDAMAQYLLGAMYYKGDGVKQDFAKAKFWYEKAAAQGLDWAQRALKEELNDVPPKN
jgi:hypothetical protein